MRRRHAASIGLTLCAVLLPARAAAQATLPLDTAAITSAVRAEMQRTGAPGASIAVIVDDSVVYARGFGSTSTEQGTAVDAHTLFRIGSVTKPITALAALSLREEGRLAFDRPIGEYMPDLHADIARLTMHELLSHMAGIIALPSADGSHDDAALQLRMLSWTDTVLFAQPGDIYSYSSPGYWLAGAILERVTGEWYADIVRARVFEPLGMTRSTLRPLAAFTWPTALDHRRAGGSVVVARPYPDDASTWPGGSVFSSALELARLAQHLLSVDVRSSRSSARDMLRPQSISIEENGCTYTYGLSHCDGESGVTLSHYGFRSGSGAVFTLVPERRAAIIILANIAGGIFGQTEGTILRMLDVQRSGSPPEPRDATDAERAALVGRYVAGADTLAITADDSGLALTARGTRYGVRINARDPAHILLLDSADRTVQTFRVVPGARTGTPFLHDGLNAFRRID